jgi:hypothetical protein
VPPELDLLGHLADGNSEGSHSHSCLFGYALRATG